VQHDPVGLTNQKHANELSRIMSDRECSCRCYHSRHRLDRRLSHLRRGLIGISQQPLIDLGNYLAIT
jgi:hypothetical protein